MTFIQKTYSALTLRFFRPELAGELHKRARDIPVLGMLTCSVVALLYAPYIGNMKAALWAVLFYLIYFSAYWFLFKPQRAPDAQSYASWSIKFALIFGAFAVMWAVVAAMALPVLGEWQRLTLLMILFGIVALPAPVFSLCMPIAVFHPIVMLVPSTLTCIVLHHDLDAHLGATLLIMFGGIGFVIKQIATTQRILRSVDDKRALSSSMHTIEKLIHDKHIDPVTGLLNKEGVRAQLSNFTGKSVSVLSIKVDGVEDMYCLHGKGIADGMVWSIARRLSGRKKPLSLLAHAGLGEFLLVTPSTKRSCLRQQAEQVFELFSTPFVTDLGDVAFRVSVGAALDEVKRADETMNNAIAAMREAGWEQGNSWQQYDDLLGSKLNQKFSIRSQLPQAISNKELSLHLQPKVDLQTGRIEGAEALVRWQSPELGMVSPAEFIPLAESTGDIIPLGRWVLHEATKFLLSSELPASFSIAVNLSSKQFSDPALLSQLKQIKKQLNGTSRSLELEITESMVMADSAEIHRTLKKIKALGFRIALDDFGTGYSSLSYLTRLQADTLKLDKSFIDPIPADEQHSAFVASIIQMVKALKLKLVAEGIETRQQYDWLLQNNCDEVQGYFLARPQDFETFLSSYREVSHEIASAPRPA